MHIGVPIGFAETIATPCEATVRRAENAMRLHFNGDASARAATTNVERFCLLVIFADDSV